MEMLTDASWESSLSEAHVRCSDYAVVDLSIPRLKLPFILLASFEEGESYFVFLYVA